MKLKVPAVMLALLMLWTAAPVQADDYHYTECAAMSPDAYYLCMRIDLDEVISVVDTEGQVPAGGIYDITLTPPAGGSYDLVTYALSENLACAPFAAVGCEVTRETPLFVPADFNGDYLCVHNALVDFHLVTNPSIGFHDAPAATVLAC